MELQETLHTLGEVMTKEEADHMMMEADANGDGRIDYEGNTGATDSEDLMHRGGKRARISIICSD